ncbi:MAG: nitric oxide synthase oxygenase [Bacilli bacterium]
MSISLIEKAKAFIETCYTELGLAHDVNARLQDIETEIAQTGTYTHTKEELLHGAKMAWRNSNRCIGRLFWQSLDVLDFRAYSEPADVYRGICEHIHYATNGGKIRPTISVFRPRTPGLLDVTIHNHQLIRYAGFETNDGIIGDPHSVPFTNTCQSLGWRGAVSSHTVLPFVCSLGENGERFLQDLPDGAVLEVPIVHEKYDFTGLGLQWYAVPIISDRELHIGGIVYTAAPFNGWYMGTEIGARNLADTDRYDMLPAVAEIMELDTRGNRTLWRDEALVALNQAVLSSYHKAGVSIVDHHTAALQFAQFERNEADAGRDVTGRWSWLVPPMSGAQTHVFHKQYDDTVVNPNFYPRSST